MTASKTPQIVGVDLIQFMAACIVMLFHLCFWIWAGGPGAMGFTVAKVPVQFHELAFFRFGTVGVNVFFVVSDSSSLIRRKIRRHMNFSGIASFDLCQRFG